MISRTVEYALRAVVWLATQPGSPRTARQIAEITHVPTNYLAKVLQTLVDAGIVRSQRGLGGGFTIARDPSKLTVLEVVNAVDPLERIRSCPLDLPAHAVRLCSLHQRLDDVMASVERAFAASPISDLLADPAAETPLGGSSPAAGNLAAHPRGPAAKGSSMAPGDAATPGIADTGGRAAQPRAGAAAPRPGPPAPPSPEPG